MLSQKAKSIKAYIAGEQPAGGGWIKLNTNENPYGFPLESIDEELSRLRLYPDPECRALKQKIASLHGVAPSRVFVGNGSDEVLALLFVALFDPFTLPVLAPDITYSFYPVYADLFDIAYRRIPLSAEFTLKAVDYQKNDCQGIILANPNAPTGIAVDNGEIEKMLISHNGIPVVVDEAYVDFAKSSAMPLVEKYSNLIVVRTLSKSYSLAGMRVGYCVASEAVIGGLERIKNSFNSYTLDTLAQKVALQAISKQEVMMKHAATVVEERLRMTNMLEQLGFLVLPSQANFVFVSHPSHSARDIYAALRERKILVRYFDASRIDNFLRITIGTAQETIALSKALEQIFTEFASGTK